MGAQTGNGPGCLARLISPLSTAIVAKQSARRGGLGGPDGGTRRTVVAWGYNFYARDERAGGLKQRRGDLRKDYNSLALRSDGTVAAWATITRT